MRFSRRYCVTAIPAILSLTAASVYGQATSASFEMPSASLTTSDTLKSVLSQPVQSTDVTAFQLQQYLSHRITPLPSPQSAGEWTEQAQKLRAHILNDVAFHGWPKEWVHSAPNFEQVGATDERDGYTVTKLRYEIVPGFNATALLYKPAKSAGRIPAILNVIGHEPMGEAAEYEQKRCINFAKRGIIALDLSWVGFGELALPGDDHDNAAALDLVGSNALGFFYLGMRRGLDYLASLPQADIGRLGVTGLSGGGWQTTMLSATDPRVAVMVEVAGFGSFPFNLTHPVDTDEVEENATDLMQGEDYPFLVAMRAPRPTLLIHNAEDDCCFRASLVKPDNYDKPKVFFNLYNKPDDLAFYESSDPGTHNYQLVNRLHAYRFFSDHFHLPTITEEIPSSTEVTTPEELAVGIPADNLSLIGLAKKLAANNPRPPIPTEGNARVAWVTSQRAKLEEVTRYKPISVTNAWRMSNTKRLAIRTLSYRFDLSNGLSATGIWLKANDAGDDAPATIVLNDKGYAAAGEGISRRVNHGEQVLALDLIFNGFTRPQTPDTTDWETLTATSGDRPLGIEVAQLIGVAHWLRTNNAEKKIQVETNGIRSAVIAAIAAAIDPETFSVITSDHAMKSLSYLLDTPVPSRSADDLYCLDLYKYFDIDSITAIAAPTNIRNVTPVQ